MIAAMNGVTLTVRFMRPVPHAPIVCTSKEPPISSNCTSLTITGAHPNRCGRLGRTPPSSTQVLVLWSQPAIQEPTPAQMATRAVITGQWYESHLELIQLNAAGETCNVTQSPDQISTVGTGAHHYMIHYELLTVPVYPRCVAENLAPSTPTSEAAPSAGVRPQYLFKLRIYVKYVSGSPVKVDGYEFTHAFAFTSAYGTAPPVPNVVGLAEGVASNTLTASGYAISIVSNAFSTVPKGTVISQDPSAGMIELPGSGVNLTLSTGSVTVPNVVSLPKDKATGDISALGLVPSVSFSKACTNPEMVIQQAPPAGSSVAPSSTVSITVDSGTRSTCVVLR